MRRFGTEVAVMEFRGAGRSETGEVRSLNQDRFWLDDDLGVFVVADGIGGKRDGERASAALVDGVADRAGQLSELLRQGDPANDRQHRTRVTNYLDRLVSKLNAEIYDMASGEMGTTCEVLALSKGGALIAHVGDSRTYLIREDAAYQLTEDHTFAERLRRQGREDEFGGIERAEYEHVLTRSIGSDPEVDVDTLFVDVQAGDRFLMCTDGVSDVLDRERLGRVGSEASADDFADRIVSDALEAGSTDNATTVVVRAGGEEFSPGDRPVDTVRKISFLEQVELFEGLDERELLKILRIVFQETARDGERIIERSEPADEMFMLLEGHVSLEIEGRQVARLGPGSHFGEMALFSSEPRSADAVADGDVVLLVVPGDQFRELVQYEDLALGNKLLRKLLERAVQRMRETTLELMEERSEPAEQANVLGKARTLELDPVSEKDRSDPNDVD